MRKHVGLVLGGIGFGIAAYILSRSSGRGRPIRGVQLSTADLAYSQVSYQEVAAEHLIDLNLADAAELQSLRLDPDSVARLMENRPYRSKLELVSRMILPESVYAGIRDRVAVSEGRDPIKVA